MTRGVRSQTTAQNGTTEPDFDFSAGLVAG